MRWGAKRKGDNEEQRKTGLQVLEGQNEYLSVALSGFTELPEKAHQHHSASVVTRQSHLYLLEVPPHWVLCTIRECVTTGRPSSYFSGSIGYQSQGTTLVKKPEPLDYQLSEDSKEYGTLVSQSSTALLDCRKHYPLTCNIKCYCPSWPTYIHWILNARNSGENYPATEEFKVFSLEWAISVLVYLVSSSLD